MEEDLPTQDTDDSSVPTQDVRVLVESTNIAENMSEEELSDISKVVTHGFEQDYQSREEWEEQCEQWTKLAMQFREDKNFPWRNASNVKYPILSTAAMQFAARAYPTLIPSNGDIVKIAVIGQDPTGEKEAKAKRVSEYLSYQILKEIEDWEEGMDKLLIMLPITGCVFKKTYFDTIEKVVRSEVVHPLDLVVDYYAPSLKEAERISQIIPMSKRKVDGLIAGGFFIKQELGDPVMAPDEPETNTQPPFDETTPYQIIEMHTFYDTDGDDYPEPVIVTFERYSGKILRIVARFTDGDIVLGDNQKIIKINPIQYYTKFPMIPSPEGSFYDIGFGSLLGPLNEAINTLVNQLVDAGTLSNLQAGWIGKGLRLKSGDTGFKPGEWKVAQAAGDDLRKQILPLPAKDPSEVLFKLMEALVGSSKELASVAEIFVGKMPGQNTPATTTMASIEQGMKVFTAVYKRIYRALAEEFKKIFRLNGLYLDPYKYVAVIDAEVNPSDFDEKTFDLIPAADPNAASEQQRLQKASALLELLQTGLLDPVEVVRRVLIAQDQPNIDKLFSQEVQQTGMPPPPQPDPKVMAMQLKAQNDQQVTQLKMREEEHKMQMNQQSHELQLAMKAQEGQINAQNTLIKAQAEGQARLHNQQIFMQTDKAATDQKLGQNEQMHQQKMRHNEETQKLAAQNKPSQTGGSKPSPKSSSGNSKAGKKN